MAESIDEDDLVLSLKQLIVNLNPILKQSAGSLEQAEEQILHLEARDANFHRYDYVKRVRAAIDAELGELMDSEIERHSIGPNDETIGMETVVSRITDHVLASPEYSHMKSELRGRVNGACRYLLEHFEHEFSSERGDNSTHSRPRRKPDPLYSDGESSFGESSFNQSTFMFMNNEQSRIIAEALDRRQPLESRRDALKRLLQIGQVDDILNCESWPHIRQGLQDAMSDSDPSLWSQSLKIMARGFSSTNHSNQSEMYAVLVEFLEMQFHLGKNSIPKIEQGLDTSTPESTKLLKAFRLLNEFQRQVPQYWVRYPEKFVDDVLELTLGLLSAAPGGQSHMNPRHFLALVDPQANWFVKWMHGHYSRAPLLKVLKRHRSMVDNAVRACVSYIQESESELTPRSATKLSSEYTGEELEYVHFVSSVHIIGNLLCYEQARDFFPIKLKERQDKPVTVSGLLVSFIEMMIRPWETTDTGNQVFNPCTLVLSQVLRKVNSSETACQQCMCNDAVTDTLLAPIRHLLSKTSSSRDAPSEQTLFRVADILALIASSSCGRNHLMYGEGGYSQAKARKSPAHILAEFSNRALNEQLSTPPSKAAIGSYVYVCRQLYNTCEGLQVLLPYNLHKNIATAWRQACREADNAATPTPSADGGKDRGSQYIVLWEDTLRDNLLNFTGTPRGVMLLEQTGAMNECVAYMYSRYERKLQVSKCEKFGYGYMMSQVAATAPGMVALRNTGFMHAQILPLWSSLEVVDDSPLYSPKQWPVLPIDKASKKSFINLVNLLSSYSAVYEILGQQPLPTQQSYTLREMPDTIAGIIDRIVLVDSDAKIHSLFNFEQSHVFGLRLLSVLTSCLDTCLLLQTQYDFQSCLLQAQADNVTDGSKSILLDMLSLERHYILVKTYVMGGPSERKLPPRTLSDGPTVFPYPLFSSFSDQLNTYVQPVAKSAMKQENELSKFLNESKKASLSSGWQDKCRRALCSVLTAKPDQPIKGNVLQDLLEKSVASSVKNPAEAIFPLADSSANDSAIKSIQLTSLQQKGVAMAIRYGQQLKLVSSGKEATDNLTMLLKQCEHFLHQHQKLSKKSPLLCLTKHQTGFDWFVATVFLLMGGNRDRAWKLLHKTTALLASGYIWLRRLHASTNLSMTARQSGIPPVFSATCHNVEFILQTELPHVYSAFKMSGYAPAQIVQQWLRQCFWNYLDWAEICHYICVCLVLGVDYQIYMCVAILKFLHTQILQQTQEKDLIVFLKEEPIRGFKVGVHLEYMQQLESKFRHLVMGDMKLCVSS